MVEFEKVSELKALRFLIPRVLSHHEVVETFMHLGRMQSLSCYGMFPCSVLLCCGSGGYTSSSSSLSIRPQSALLNN
jgi:hypothetical protein